MNKNMEKMRAILSRLQNVRLGFNFGAGFLSAVLLVLSFPPYGLWPLLFVGLVPFLWQLLSAKSWKDPLKLGLTTTIWFNLLGLYWVGDVATNFGDMPWIVGKLVLILFSLIGELQFLFFAMIVFFLSKGLRNAKPQILGVFYFVCAPALYLALDFAYPKIFNTTLGQALYPWLSLVQVVEFTGVYGLTLPIFLVNMAIALLLAGRLPQVKERLLLALPSLKVTAGVLAGTFLVLLIASGWGGRRIAQLKTLQKDFPFQMPVSIIQANIGDLDKLASEKGYKPALDQVLETYREMTLQAKVDKPQLVVWPETAYPLLYTHGLNKNANLAQTANDEWIADLMKQMYTSFFFGGYSMLGTREFNSAFLLLPPNFFSGVYQKSILMPYGEYVPLGPLADLVKGMVPAIADFGRGKGPTTMAMGTVKLGPQICYEGIVPWHSRQTTREGADVFVNITNDSWFGRSSEPALHFLLTIFRTIENRRPMIRATNTGISAFIDITGDVLKQTKTFEAKVLTQIVSLPGEANRKKETFNTFYTRNGDLFSMLMVALAILSSVAVAVLPRFSRD